MLEGGAIRASSTKTTRSAIGPSVTDFDLAKESTSRITAENYFARGRYEYQLSRWGLLYGGAGWTRNTFTGVASRYSAAVGIGNTWLDDDTVALQTDYAFTYTIQDEVIDDPSSDDAFFGVRLSWSYRYQGNETSAFETLTPREREVLQLVAEGQSTKKIATRMNHSSKTIEFHRHRVMKKLDLNNIAELTKYAIRSGITTLEN